MGLFSGLSNVVSSAFGSSGTGSGYAALAQYAGDVASGFINNAYATSAAQRDYRYAKQLIDYQNEYNLPINQRKRLEEAGLNPNYILGGISSTSASGSASGGTGGRMNSSLALAQYHNLEAQNRLIGQQASTSSAQEKEIEAQTQNVRAQARINKAKARVAEKEAQIYEDTGLSSSNWIGQMGQFAYDSARSVGSKAIEYGFLRPYTYVRSLWRGEPYDYR